MLSSASLNLESALFILPFLLFWHQALCIHYRFLLFMLFRKELKFPVLFYFISYFWCYRNTADMPVCLYMAGISQLIQFGIS